MYYCDIKPVTRQRTPEGILRAQAVITRSGIFEHSGSELGMDTPVVTINRSRESVTHPDTIASIRGAAVTLGHPPGGGIGPGSWQDRVVGNVFGEPTVGDDGLVRADIQIGRQDAIDAIENGTHQLSIGYDFSYVPAESGAGYDLLTAGPIRVNHVAIVASGRAGENVRIQDSRRDGEDSVPQNLKEDIQKAVDEAMRASSGKPQSEVNSVLTNVLTQVLGRVEQIDERQQKADEEARKARFEAEAKKAADELIAKTTASVDAKWKMLNDALPLLGEEARAKFTAMSSADVNVKDLLVAAVGPHLQNAGSMDEQQLSGALAMLKATQSVNSPPPAHAGVQPPAGTGLAKLSAADSNTAAKGYVDRLTGAWKDGVMKGPS